MHKAWLSFFNGLKLIRIFSRRCILFFVSDQLSEISWKPLEPYPEEVLFREERGEHAVVIVRVENPFSKIKPLVITPEKIKQLAESAFAALGLERQISEEFDPVCHLKLVPTVGHMEVNGALGQAMLDDSSDSQQAAILHEDIHDLQERFHFEDFNDELLPELAEFLFTGESRLPKYKSMHAAYYTGTAMRMHHKAWGRVVEILLPGVRVKDPDELFNILLKLRELSEEEKIAIVRRALESAYDRAAASENQSPASFRGNI